MEYQAIIVDHVDRVATVTINRPQAMNSFNKRMLDEFAYFWRWAAETEDVHCIVLRAAKGRAFSTGADVRESTDPEKPENKIVVDDVWLAADPGEKLGPKQMRCWKPVVCAIHGLAAGGAFYWISECDVVICSDDATFFDPHVTYGMTSALEPILASYRMPLGDVLRMVLLGNDERISAHTALRLGLVTEVTSQEALWDRADELARKIAAKPSAATQGSVRAIWESLDMPRGIALQTALKYCQLGNPVGVPQVDRWEIMGKGKQFETR
ncbi:MAG: enoyl-CoA hydratase/isomerase family protein [Sphingomonadaceae bacterium]|nr:enoyl-CoA hydratase/isomerase family protein [Sphingomonadaceae bacterium]